MDDLVKNVHELPISDFIQMIEYQKFGKLLECVTVVFLSVRMFNYI